MLNSKEINNQCLDELKRRVDAIVRKGHKMGEQF